MFYYKFNFLIFLILFVDCFSYDSPGGSKNRRKPPNDYTICMQNMSGIFGNNKEPLECIRHAIEGMKLYGEHRNYYSPDVTFYYQRFHLDINYQYIELPKQFCINYFGLLCEDCYKYLKIFEEIQDDTFIDFEPDELQILHNAFSEPYDFTQGESSLSQSEPIVLNEKQIMQTKVLKNALYYHKLGEPAGIVMTDQSRRFFHRKNSYGDYYLKEISRTIRLGENYRSTVKFLKS